MSEIKAGDIYSFANNRIRVIMSDNKEVFYVSDPDNPFNYKPSKTITYYRTSRDFFEQNSQWTGSMNFSPKETEIHRPDLPLRLNCSTGIFWADKPFQNEKDFVLFLESNGISAEELEGLALSTVFIIPESQQMSAQKPVLIQNGKGVISGIELLYECFNIQSKYVSAQKPYFSRFRLIPDGREEKRLSGIGLYRSGIKGNIPSFYIGGEISMQELESDKSRIVRS